ncbi:MAG TPA: hypothetical protein VNS63_25045 [Blastocatellia bacterium]|nr:hypothetical protein [Blastocatellia bacterium]
MKRQMFLFSIVSILVLAAWALASQAPAQKPRTERALPPLTEQIKPQVQTEQIQKAVVEFVEPVKLLGAILKGSYLFLHDEQKMARGEPCTWVYGRGESGKFDKLVASFHCIPVQRDEPAKQFKVTITGVLSPFTLPEVVEYRFAGSTEGHQVPKAD